MLKATQAELTDRVIGFIDRSTTELAAAVYRNPVATYADPEHLRREQTRLFRHTPQLFCLTGDLPKPGDWRAEDLSGVPILVTRSQDGRLNAFLNVCRHRGARLAEGCGSGKRLFVCPYHAWSYGLDGKLARLPAEGFEGLSAAEHGLTRLPVAEKHGLVWVTAAPGGEIDVDELLGGLGPEMASYRLASHVPYKTARLEKRMNWKLVIDTFLETWHVVTLHKETVAPIFQPNVNAFDAFGRNGRLIIPRRTIVEMRGGKGPEDGFLKHTAIVYQLFPNSALVWQADHFELWRAFPVGDDPARCITEATLYAPEPPTTDKAKRYWDRNFDLLMRTVEAEDFPVCEGIQKGLLSGAQDHITFGRNEPALGHYHASLAAAMRG